MKQKTETIQIPVFVKAKEGICYFDIDDDSNNVNNVSDILVEHINNLELRDQTAKVVLISKRDVINYYLNKIALITSHYYEFNNHDTMIWCIPHDVSYNIKEDTIEIYDVRPNKDPNGICLAINYGKAKYGIPYKRFINRIKDDYTGLLDWYNGFMKSYF